MDQVRHIFRWDLDKTYLKTEFDSFTDLVRTARLSAEQRENIPGSAALIRTIRHAQAHESEHLVFFISGSPEQLRSVLEKKFTLDGFHPDGFQLKPTVSNILHGRFRAVRGQVSYKLGQLLQGRAEAPIGTKETLFGDDAESDAFIYSLYADMVAGRVSQEHLEKVLVASGAYRSQINEVLEALEAIVHENPVRRIIIHLDQHSPPVAFQPYFPRVVPIYNHLQTALVLVLDRTLDAPSVQRVAWELLDRYGFEAARLLNLAEDILRRRRAYHDAQDFEWLASEIDKLDNPEDEADAQTVSVDELSNRTRDLMADIASLARHLAARPVPPASGVGRRNYVQMWKDEQTRQDEAKRARKLATKISRDEERARAKLAKQQLAKDSKSKVGAKGAGS